MLYAFSTVCIALQNSKLSAPGIIIIIIPMLLLLQARITSPASLLSQ